MSDAMERPQNSCKASANFILIWISSDLTKRLAAVLLVVIGMPWSKQHTYFFQVKFSASFLTDFCSLMFINKVMST